jgi:membrane protease YdiL (CAAX protease family)
LMKGKSILDASIVFTVFMVVTTMIPGVRSLIRWEGRALGGSYFTGVLIVVLTLVASIVTKLDFEEIGIKSGNWKESLNMGFKGFLSFLVPQFVLTTFWSFGLDYKEYWQSALIQSVLVLLFTFLLVRNIGSKQGEISRLRLVLIILVLGTPFVLGFVYDALSTRLLTTFIWQILVGGFSEELLFRGYIQSTVNREYGTNWRIKGVNFGPGLLVSSTLYGLSRALITMNFGWGVYAFTLGIFYGLIREASGDIIGSGSANAIIDGFGATLIKVLR